MHSQKSTPLYLILSVVCLLTVLGCAVTSEIPPTLAPSTPLSTITPQAGVFPPTLQPQPLIGGTPPSGAVQSTPAAVTRPLALDKVDANRMMTNVRTLVGFETRHILSTTTSTRGIGAAQQFLRNELRNIAASSPFPDIVINVYDQQFSMEWGGRQVNPSNLVMAVTGTDPSAGAVFVTAHYDTTLTDWFSGDAYQPGANDNASGVAAILEMARIIVQERHRATIVFVLFSAEEERRAGSLEFVNGYLKPLNIPVTGAINLDIIGSPTGRRGERYDDRIRVFSEGPNETSGSRQLARGIRYAVERYLPEMTVVVEGRVDRPGRWGDHQSFSEAGYPAVRLIEAVDDATIAHTTRDTADRIDIAYYQRTTQVALAALLMMADGPNPPTLKPLYATGTNPNNLTLEWSRNPVCQSYEIALRSADSTIYDQFYTVQGTTSVTWDGFTAFEAVTVTCVDTQGRIGRFAPELMVQRGIAGN